MTTATVSPTIWLRSPRFDVSLQLAALVGIAPALLIYAAMGAGRASTMMPIAALIAIPFVHVFGSFFFAFSTERNRSAASPRQLALQWAAWIVALVVLREITPRGLATFALVYGSWHILRQNFGFLRELGHRGGLAQDPTLRRYDLAACAAPAVALCLLVSARGPWSFIGVDIYHAAVPSWLLALAFAAVPGTWLAREVALRSRARQTRPATALLLAGNAVALLGPALFLDDLTLIYTLSASYHGLQYLAYVAAREREGRPGAHPDHVLLPLASMILLSMMGWFVAMAMITSVLSPQRAEQALLVGWYAIVPFHYFVDGRIWRRAKPAMTAVSLEPIG